MRNNPLDKYSEYETLKAGDRMLYTWGLDSSARYQFKSLVLEAVFIKIWQDEYGEQNNFHFQIRLLSSGILLWADPYCAKLDYGYYRNDKIDIILDGC